MNIHEYQAKEILRNYKVPVPNGIIILKLTEIEEKIKKLLRKGHKNLTNIMSHFLIVNLSNLGNHQFF